MTSRRDRILLTVAILLLTGCDLRLQMYSQPRFDSYEATDLFPDGRSARPPIPGTIARGQLEDDDMLHRGLENGKLASRFPFPIDAAGLARGRQRYNIYCAPCHAMTGAGDGMIVQRGFSAPPSFHADELRAKPEGHYYQVIANGFGQMPSYAAQIPARDRWLITAYVRALQLSHRVPASQLTEAERIRADHKPEAAETGKEHR